VLSEAAMQKKLTITVDERVYEGLHTVIGRRRISQFIESLVRPYVVGKDLEVAYQQMAQDEAREAEALEWAEATAGDVADETR
jgi:predicted CopG family antitoxin